MRNEWSFARDDLVCAITELGFPAELGDAVARHLGSPKAMDRMTAYLLQARPRSLETVVDEMLAIRADVDAWIRKKESEAAQAGMTSWLNSEERWHLGEPD